MRPMLLFNHDAVLTAWAGARLGIADFRPCTTIGVARDGVILAAAIYNNYRPPNIEITFVTASAHWASKGAIRAMLRYPFVQLACKRLTAPRRCRTRLRAASCCGWGFAKRACIWTRCLPARQ